MNRHVPRQKNNKIAGTNRSWTAEKQLIIAGTNRACGDKNKKILQNESKLNYEKKYSFSYEIKK
jgi:hypothetical protein